MQQSADLSELRALVALVDAGSFVAAAAVLGRDATIVSRRLSALEARLGVRLVERTTRRVALTEAGLDYLARVRPLLQELEMADREASSFAGGEPRGHLKIALPGTFARLWLAPIVVGFARAHPRVSLEVHYSNRFVDLVGEGFDLAVRLAELPDSRLVARKVGERRRLLCASLGYLATRPAIREPADVPAHDCLVFTGRPDPYRWPFRAPDGGTRPAVVAARIASDDAEVLVEAALAGLGLMLTTDWHVGPALAEGKLVEVLPEWPVADSGAIYVLMPAGNGVPSKTRAFSDWLARGLTEPPWRPDSAARQSC